MFTLILLSLLIIFLKSFHLLYLFQIKEYRFDRFLSYANEEGLAQIVYSLRLNAPARSFRNILIMIYISITLFLLFLASFEVPFIYYFFTFVVPFAPIVSLFLVAFGVFITKFPAMIHRKLLIFQAKLKVQHTNTKFIGITGSYGKTSVKEYLFHILSTQFKTAKTDENMNTDVGIAISILKHLKNDTEYFVTEFGAYKKDEIKKASSYIPLEYAILTGLGNQHIDLYGSRTNLIDEETYILSKVPKHGTVYLKSGDDIDSIKQNISAQKVMYGFQKYNDISAKIHNSDPFMQKATIQYRNNSFEIQTELLGEHSVENLLPAIAIALDLGMNSKDISEAIKRLKPLQGKLSVRSGHKKALVLDDGVNSNVNGFISAIHVLNSIPRKHKLIISQGIIELGVEKRQSYERVLRELYKTEIILYTTDDLFKQIDEKHKGEQVVTFNDVNTMIQEVLTSTDKQYVILIEGKFSKKVTDQLFR